MQHHVVVRQCRQGYLQSFLASFFNCRDRLSSKLGSWSFAWLFLCSLLQVKPEPTAMAESIFISIINWPLWIFRSFWKGGSSSMTCLGLVIVIIGVQINAYMASSQLDTPCLCFFEDCVFSSSSSSLSRLMCADWARSASNVAMALLVLVYSLEIELDGFWVWFLLFVCFSSALQSFCSWWWISILVLCGFLLQGRRVALCFLLCILHTTFDQLQWENLERAWASDGHGCHWCQPHGSTSECMSWGKNLRAWILHPCGHGLRGL